MSMFHDAAAYYVGLGWQVIPLAPGFKVPAIKGGRGFKDASDDASVIDKWAVNFPSANIGIATGIMSGIVVVDIDPRNGGTASMTALAGRGFVLPQCPEAQTGNGGLHLYFSYDPRIKASKDRLGAGIDIKTDGGYVVAAPSVIAASAQGSGGTYRWNRKPEDVGLPNVPQWLLEMLTPKVRMLPRFEPVSTAEGAARSLEGIAKRLAGAGQGERNNVLNWGAYAAAKLVQRGQLGSSAVTSRLIQAGLSAGLPLPEVQATIASAFRAVLSDRSGQ